MIATRIKSALLSIFIMLALSFARFASGTPMLTGAMIFDGRQDGIGFTWSTNTYGYYLFLASGAPNANIINDTQGHVNHTLSPGDHQFFFFGDWDRGTAKDPPWTLVLGFDGQTAIAAYSLQSGVSAGTDEASSPYTSQTLQDSWSNSRLLTLGDFSIELLDYNIFVPDVSGQDRVQPFAIGPNGRDDAIGSFALRITDNALSVPEPKPFALLSIALVLMYGFRRNFCINRVSLPSTA